MPRAHATAAARVASLSCSDRMKQALVLIVDGCTYRDSAKEVGYRDHREVYRWAKRAGLLDVHTENLVAGYKRITALSNAELERRLVEHPEGIPTRDLAIIGGIAADKAARYENWGKPQEPDRSELLNHLFDRLQASSAGIELKVEVSRQDQPPHTIEIDRG